MSTPLLSIVVPVYNEAGNIEKFYAHLEPIIREISEGSYEIIYVDDGSRDTSAHLLGRLNDANPQVKLLSLSRNFGKEIALAAGVAAATGEAIITIDADGQHPVERITDFVAAWREGADVVVGIRKANSNEGMAKKYGSRMFYSLFNRISDMKLIPGSSDFRLISRQVQQEFIRLQEPNTMTRALIDWLGFPRAYIEYVAHPRTAGDAGYSLRKLFKLAANSFVSLSPTPLYIFGYLGVFITSVSFILGVSILIEQISLHDPWHWQFTGTAMLSVLVLFLVGLILVAQGVLALYVSAIHSQSKNRPLFVINRKGSRGISFYDQR